MPRGILCHLHLGLFQVHGSCNSPYIMFWLLNFRSTSIALRRFVSNDPVKWGGLWSQQFVYHDFPIHLLVDITGNKKCTRAIFSLRSSAIGVICNGVSVAPSTFTTLLFAIICQDYTACAASINESANSNYFSLGLLEVLMPRNIYMDGRQFDIGT